MEAMVDIDGTEFLYQGSQAHHRLPDDNGPWHCVRSTYLFTVLRPLTPRRCPPLRTTSRLTRFTAQSKSTCTSTRFTRAMARWSS